MLFYGVLYVPFYSINDCLVNRKWIVVFSSVQLFSEGKLYSITSLIYFYCIAYETSLVDETYEFIQDPEVVFSEAQANVELAEAPNSDSEQPKTTDSLDFNTGKPRCTILLFYATYYHLLVHLSYWSWMQTLNA